MAWNGTGTFSMLYSWVARRDAGSPTNIIGATEMDAQFSDIATGLMNCVARDGQNAASANLPMGGFLHTNVAAATSRTNYARVAEVQDGTVFKAATPGGTGDAMTGTVAPAPSAYTAGQRFTIVAPGANTVTNPTANFNALGAKTIKRRQAALVIGEYASGDTLELIYDGTNLELINGKYASPDLASLTTDSTGGAAADFIPFVDASESNAPNKVLVPDFFTNGIAALTTDSTGGATGDLIPFTDASESNAANKVTIDSLLANSMQLLAAETLIVASDYVVMVDTSESSAGNKIQASIMAAGMIHLGTAITPSAFDYYIPARKTSDSSINKVLIDEIGIGKQTVWIPAAAMTARTTNGAATGTTESTTNKVMNKVLDFDTTTQEFAQFNVAMPKGWNLGTVTFIPYWTAASGSGGVVWALQGVAVSDDDVIDAAFGTEQTSTDTLIATTDVHVGPESAAITIAGTPAVGDIVYFQIKRNPADANDTLGVDARLIGIRLIYSISKNVDD